MANASDQVSTKTLVDTKGKPISVGRRREWSEALKRQIVAETQEPGSSVSIVARRHDVNANQLFKWRRELMPERSALSHNAPPTLLPILQQKTEVIPAKAATHGQRRRSRVAGGQRAGPGRRERAADADGQHPGRQRDQRGRGSDGVGERGRRGPGVRSDQRMERQR